MGVKLSDFQSLLRKLLPPGRAWVAEEGSVLRKLLNGIAKEFHRVNERALDLLRESDPREALETLEDYERVYALPEIPGSALGTVDERRKQLVYKVTVRGSLAPSYYQEIAQVFGYTVQVVPARPFRAGRSKAGDPCYGPEWRFWWWMKATDYAVASFKAGSGKAGEPLRSWGNEVLEYIIDKKKPSHTKVLFSYGS